MFYTPWFRRGVLPGAAGDRSAGAPAAAQRRQYSEGRVADGAFTVSRLISTDPKLYLDPRHMPGRSAKRNFTSSGNELPGHIF